MANDNNTELCPICGFTPCAMDTDACLNSHDADAEGERRMLDRDYQRSLRIDSDPREWDDNGSEEDDAHPDYGPEDTMSEDDDFSDSDDDLIYSGAGEDSDVAQGMYDE